MTATPTSAAATSAAAADSSLSDWIELTRKWGHLTLADAFRMLDSQSADLREANEAILELQRAACARDGVPMPSERPVVERLRAINAELVAVARYAANVTDPHGSRLVINRKMALHRMAVAALARANAKEE